MPVALVPGPGGAVGQDPQQLLSSVLTAGHGALLDIGVPVGAVEVTNQGETVLRWEPVTGDAHGSAISWQDRRAAQHPALESLGPLSCYAGPRPAGRGVDDIVGPSVDCPRPVDVAAIRSTDLTASLGIAAHVADLLPEVGSDVGLQLSTTPEN